MTVDARVDFETERGRLTGLAYRMLGSLSDAEDIVQDAWLRWHGADQENVERPQAYLSSIVTRLCLDRLKEARRKREVYVGPWLPEPVWEDPAVSVIPEERVAGDVSFALMLALERLSPLERAAFILHDVFEIGFSEIAQTLDRTETACRQLAKRAREHLSAEQPRFAVDPQGAEAVAEAFFTASRSGDVEKLGKLLSADVTLHTDGGGRKLAALNIISGADKVARFFAGLARKPAARPPIWSRRVTANGIPALLTLEADGTRQISAVEVRSGRVGALYVIRNPEKLEKIWAEVGA